VIKTGPFFEEVPGGGDLYVLKHVVHDWHDEEAQAVLRRVRAAMSPESRLLLVKTVLPPLNKGHFGKLLDLDVLIFMGGKERTIESSQSR
jgi:hypothetical protein